MTLKLTYNQAEALKLVFEEIIIPEVAANVADKLVKEIMKQVYRKIRAKLEARIKDGYSLTLTDIEAMAFYVYFQGLYLHPQWIYEQNFINELLVLLDKAYA